MNKLNINKIEWETINKKQGILKSSQSEWVIADFTELLSQLEAKHNSRFKGLRVLWSESRLSADSIANILNNYRAINKRYSRIDSLLKEKLASTGLRDKLDKISRSLYEELKAEKVNQADLNLIKPFLKSKSELAVEEKYHDYLVFNYNMKIWELEQDTKDFYKLIERKEQELTDMKKKIKNKNSWSSSALNVLTLGGNEVHPQQANRKRLDITNLEAALAEKKSQLVNLYQSKQEFILQQVQVMNAKKWQ